MPSYKLLGLPLTLLSCAHAAPATSSSQTGPFASFSSQFASFTSSSQPRPSAVSYANVTSHGPYTGPPATTTGALSTSILRPSIQALPPPPGSYDYPADGSLHANQPAPFTPSGGVGTNGSAPVYRVQSDFDYQSLALALYQEWIELDLFNWGLATFSVAEFQAYGLNAEDRFLIEYMANQEIGHATLITDMLGSRAPKQCTYNYPVKSVPEFIDFNQKLTRWGEAGVYGFLPHLDSGPAAQMLLQSITVEARQQMIFRQLGGMFPMPEWQTPSIPQSWAWTLLAPYISSCPQNQTRLVWQNFPALFIVNQPNPALVNGSSAINKTVGGSSNTLSTAGIPPSQLCINQTDPLLNCSPAVTHNRSIPLSYPGRVVYLQWDAPGQLVGPNNSYVTTTTAQVPKYAAWVSQLNVTYSPLFNVSGRTAQTIQPNVSTWLGDPAINGTMFLALTDNDLYVTPYNLTMLNPHVAALAVYQAG
ncbi:Protein rds1 [Ophiocordyceps camponoti-floridani]|uniref:Protein rds1 n=1 Tax=Ophiocordyceps camponoti-floridani TaxID=2030778 RepID=A0A8H4QCD3_9HYPO|nr:Protein rds1 [Ophiocordyceps camponoti-floridani]